MRVIDCINTAVELTGISNRNILPVDMKNTLIDFLNLDYQQIYSSYPWRDVKIFNLSVTTLSGIITLPQTVDSVRAVRSNDIALFPINEIKLNYIAPEEFSSSGTAIRTMYELPHPVETQPTTASKLKFVSTHASDTSIIRIKGTSGGKTEYENLTLNGMTSVTSFFSYTEVLQITKAVTVGRIIISLADDTEIGYIQPEATNPRYERIKIIQDPGDGVTITLQCKRRFERLISDYDSPLMDIGHVLTKMLSAAIYTNLSHEPEKGSILKQEAIELLMDFFKSEEMIPDRDTVMIPAIGVFSDTAAHRVYDLSVSGIYSNG